MVLILRDNFSRFFSIYRKTIGISLLVIIQSFALIIKNAVHSNILFLPCGHLISCAQCSINMKKECPYDHIPINKYVVLKGNTEYERLNCVKCKTNKVQKIYTKCQHSTCDKCSIKSKCPVCFKRSLSKKIYLI